MRGAGWGDGGVTTFGDAGFAVGAVFTGDDVREGGGAFADAGGALGCGMGNVSGADRKAK